jgi:hypothetical protein
MTTVAQLSLEQQVLAVLSRSSQTFDELFSALPNGNWVQLTLALDRLSRDGQITVWRTDEGEYRVMRRQPAETNCV